MGISLYKESSFNGSRKRKGGAFFHSEILMADQWSLNIYTPKRSEKRLLFPLREKKGEKGKTDIRISSCCLYLNALMPANWTPFCRVLRFLLFRGTRLPRSWEGHNTTQKWNKIKILWHLLKPRSWRQLFFANIIN